MIEKTAAIRMFAAVHKFNYNNDDYGLDYKLEMYLDLIRKNFGDEWADTIYNDIVLKKSRYMAYDTVDICEYENKAIAKGRMLFVLTIQLKNLQRVARLKLKSIACRLK